MPNIWQNRKCRRKTRKWGLKANGMNIQGMDAVGVRKSSLSDRVSGRGGGGGGWGGGLALAGSSQIRSTWFFIDSVSGLAMYNLHHPDALKMLGLFHAVKDSLEST